jgi:hypothetical protein
LFWSISVFQEPHEDSAAGMGVFFTQVPLAYSKKLSQGDTDRSRADRSRPTPGITGPLGAVSVEAVAVVVVVAADEVAEAAGVLEAQPVRARPAAVPNVNNR